VFVETPLCGDGAGTSTSSATTATSSTATAATRTAPDGLRQHVVTAGELCDDGNLVDGDGCDSNCTPTAAATRS
jgi:cysteine-rich repeat protein